MTASNTLTAKAITELKRRLGAGALQAGDKLPTLQDLSAEMGVSRTVVREAVAVLRSEGLVEARHGVGVFVREASQPGIEQPNPLASRMEPLAQLNIPFMDLLELRMAFEVHAAGLAAQRRSWAQEAKIWEALREFEARIEEEDALDELDYAFHRAISEATNNAAFIEFFMVMSKQIMPQPAFSKALNPTLITPEYIRHTPQEHLAICEAISAGDENAARDAMHAHLVRSHQRYRGFRDDATSPLSNQV